MTLLLCEINPAAQDDLLALGFQWGQSRVIAAARAEYAKLAAGGAQGYIPRSLLTLPVPLPSTTWLASS